MDEQGPAVEARALKRRFGEVHAVNGISFEIQRGECFGFLGPNGAGKTTTMRMIYRAIPLGEGSLKVLGWDVGNGDHDRAIKARIGVVPQDDNLDQDLSVRENLEVFARFHRLLGRAARKRADELLAFAQLTEKADAKVLHLSGGMKRRLLIARGLIGDPELVILDEPTTGLDPRARETLWEQMGTLKKKRATLLLSTHYMHEAERLCDRLVIMNGGKIVARGAPRALIKEHVSPYVVEVTLKGDEASEQIEALEKAAANAEVLRDRMLLYGDEGEPLIGKAAQLLPGRAAMLRPASLEDVFLRLTGRGLGES